MGLQGVGHDLVTEQQQREQIYELVFDDSNTLFQHPGALFNQSFHGYFLLCDRYQSRLNWDLSWAAEAAVPGDSDQESQYTINRMPLSREVGQLSQSSARPNLVSDRSDSPQRNCSVGLLQHGSSNRQYMNRWGNCVPIKVLKLANSWFTILC